MKLSNQMTSSLERVKIIVTYDVTKENRTVT